jgi:hypothetical protein
VLAGPVGWRITQSGDADAAWQASLDGGRNQVGSKEGERYGHVDLPYAVPFSLCYASHKQMTLMSIGMYCEPAGVYMPSVIY